MDQLDRLSNLYVHLSERFIHALKKKVFIQGVFYPFKSPADDRHEPVSYADHKNAKTENQNLITACPPTRVIIKPKLEGKYRN